MYFFRLQDLQDSPVHCSAVHGTGLKFSKRVVQSGTRHCLVLLWDLVKNDEVKVSADSRVPELATNMVIYRINMVVLAK